MKLLLAWGILSIRHTTLNLTDLSIEEAAYGL
jgi:hypothetical protein